MKKVATIVVLFNDSQRGQCYAGGGEIQNRSINREEAQKYENKTFFYKMSPKAPILRSTERKEW